MGIVQSTSSSAKNKTTSYLRSVGEKFEWPGLDLARTGESRRLTRSDLFDPPNSHHLRLYPREPSRKKIGIPDTKELDSKSAERLVADEPALKEWLERKFDTNVYFEFAPPSNLLAYAVRAQKIESVRLLLEAGADINQKYGSHQCSSLHLAAEQPSIEILEMLIAHGANVNSLDTRRRTPLHYAVRHHDVYKKGFPAIKALIKHGANPLMRTVDNDLASDGLYLRSSEKAKEWLKQQEALAALLI